MSASQFAFFISYPKVSSFEWLKQKRDHKVLKAKITRKDRKLLLSAVFCFCTLLFAHPALAGWTTLCNGTSEDLYVATRYHTAVLGSRTDGWTKIPVRGVFRSCEAFNRNFRNNYFVLGVERNGNIVPIVMTLREYDLRIEAYACVNEKLDNFSYSSTGLSNDTCDNGYNLARISFGVVGGSNDVELNLRGSINVPEDKQISREEVDQRLRSWSEWLTGKTVCDTRDIRLCVRKITLLEGGAVENFSEASWRVTYPVRDLSRTIFCVKGPTSVWDTGKKLDEVCYTVEFLDTAGGAVDAISSNGWRRRIFPLQR